MSDDETMLILRALRKGNRAKRRCPRGHLLSSANIYVLPRDGTVACRKCRALARKRYIARKARAAAPKTRAAKGPPRKSLGEIDATLESPAWRWLRDLRAALR